MKLRKWTALLLTFTMLATLISTPGITPLGDLFAMVTHAADEIAINETNFPDEWFRAEIQYYDKDKNGFLSESEISKAKKISYDSSSTNMKLNSLKGIEYFTSLTELSCQKSAITSLDVSQNTALKKIYLSENSRLTLLNASGCSSLGSLYCLGRLSGSEPYGCTSLDVSGCTSLTSLDCSFNQLSSLDVSDCTSLTSLNCSVNQLTSLNIDNCTALTSLSCFSNQLSSLDVTNCTSLTSLACDSNQLSSLDVTNCTALTSLTCDSNQLSSLDVTNFTALKTLRCA